MKHLTFTRILITTLFSCFYILSFAQPANDDCVNAIVISNPVAFCSGSGEKFDRKRELVGKVLGRPLPKIILVEGD